MWNGVEKDFIRALWCTGHETKLSSITYDFLLRRRTGDFKLEDVAPPKWPPPQMTTPQMTTPQMTTPPAHMEYINLKSGMSGA